MSLIAHAGDWLSALLTIGPVLGLLVWVLLQHWRRWRGGRADAPVDEVPEHGSGEHEAPSADEPSASPSGEAER